MKQIALGQWPAVGVQAAAAQWLVLRDARAGGADPAGQRRADRLALKKPTPLDPKTYAVRAVVQGYITGHLLPGRAAPGARAAQLALERLLDDAPDFAARPAASITRADAFDLLDARRAKPTATAKLRSLLGGAWDYALDAGRLDDGVPNWWRLVMKGRLKSKGKLVSGKHLGQQRRVLHPAEVGELLGWLPNLHALGSDALQLYLWTCTRGVEILAMRPELISEEADGWWWTVPRALTKNARFEQAVDLRVPLLGRALEIVRRRLAGVGASGWLFEDVRGDQYTQHDLSTYIYHLQPYSAKAQNRQGAGLVLPVTGWTPHNLRRTSRTLLAALGCSDEIAEAIMGHLPADIVGVYNAYSYDAERRMWLARLSQRLEEIAAAHVAGLSG